MGANKQKHDNNIYDNNNNDNDKNTNSSSTTTAATTNSNNNDSIDAHRPPKGDPKGGSERGIRKGDPGKM